MRIGALLSALALLALSTQLNGQAALSLQGTLQKSTGLTVEDGEYSLTFKLYTTESGGTPVWTETQDAVDVTGGVYSVILGSVNPLTASFDQPYFLGITIGTGAEATPRARLTSSPYALSLIGQSNTFPSSGPVGVGTAAPTSDVELHVKDTEAAAKLLVESTAGNSTMEVLSSNGVPEVLVNSTKWGNHPRLTLRRGTTGSRSQLMQYTTSWGGGMLSLRTTAPYMEFRFDSTNMVPISLTSNGAIGFQNPYFGTEGAYQFYVDGWERVNINETRTAIYQQLVVSGYSPLQFWGRVYTSGTNYYANGETWDMSINCEKAVKALAFIAVSDSRIKKDVANSNNKDDLASLLKLRVVDYHMKDEVQHGTKRQKGLIAQEVAELLPPAVSKRKDVIPDIYALSERVELNGEEMTIAVKDKHGLNLGDKVRLISEKTKGGEALYEVSRVNGENSFTVSGWTAGSTDKVFVYGREVEDFHTVNYDYIHTLNVSATQELARRVLELEAQNTSLLQDKAEMKHQMDGLGQRLAKLENLVTGSAQR